MMLLRVGLIISIFIISLFSLIFYITFTSRNYIAQRQRLDHSRLRGITDARILGLIGKVEFILQPEVRLTYYSMKTSYDKSTLPWQFFIGGMYHIEGVWPNAQREVIILSDAMLENMTDDQLLFVIGHEVGHAKMDHLMRNRSFYLVHRSMLFSIIGALEIEWFEEYLYQIHLEAESKADSFGLRCSTINDAIIALTTIETVGIFKGQDTRVIEDRKRKLAENYEKK